MRMKNWLWGLILVCFGGVFSLVGVAISQENENFSPYPSGVILHYYGFGDDIGTIGVPLYNFDEHLQILADGDYRVERLSTLMERISNQDETLPSRTIAIVVSGGSRTFKTRAWERFQQYNMPVSLFFTSRPYGKEGVSDLGRCAVHAGNGELGSRCTGKRDYKNLIGHVCKRGGAKSILCSYYSRRKNWIRKSSYFAYPFGLTSNSVGRMVYNAGFVAAVGQHSGAFDRTHNRFYLPSFGLTKNYSDAKRLKLVLSTLSLPIKGLSFDSLVQKEDNPPMLKINFQDGVFADKLNISCFHSQQGRLEVKRTSSGFSPVFVSSIRKGRSRLNCTAPVEGKRHHVVWFISLYVPQLSEEKMQIIKRISIALAIFFMMPFMAFAESDVIENP